MSPCSADSTVVGLNIKSFKKMKAVPALTNALLVTPCKMAAIPKCGIHWATLVSVQAHMNTDKEEMVGVRHGL